MPASEFLLSMFITICSLGLVGNSAMKTWLEGLQLWHTINDTPWHGSHLLCCTLRVCLFKFPTPSKITYSLCVQGAAKVVPQTSHQAKRDPVTIDHLKVLHRHLDLMDTFNIAIFALACVAFWCCCHLRELLIDTKFNPVAHATCSTEITKGTTTNGTKFINLTIPHTKTEANGARIYMSDSTCEYSAISAFEHHLMSNNNIPNSSPLFSFKTAEGSWVPMRRMRFLEQLQQGVGERRAIFSQRPQFPYQWNHTPTLTWS